MALGNPVGDFDPNRREYGPSSPVQIYAEEDRRLPRRLRKMIEERIRDLTELVTSGQPGERHYQFSCGKIRAFREALDDIAEISKELGIE